MSKRISHNFIDLTGQKFNYLTVINRAKDPRSRVFWNCVCKCNNHTIVESYKLRTGHTKSCGCHSKEVLIKRSTTHGMSKSRTYKIWCKMHERCENQKDIGFHNYGGRGIQVCDRWNKFENFYADMGECPKNFSIDRKDTNGNYTAENCRYADAFTQANNTRVNDNITFEGRTLTLTQWARCLGMRQGTLWKRLYLRNWPIEKALTTPVHISTSHR